MNGKNLVSSSLDPAKARYDALRKEMELRYPAAELTMEEKQAAARAARLDSLVEHNSFRPEQKKKAPGSTRTFG